MFPLFRCLLRDPQCIKGVTRLDIIFIFIAFEAKAALILLELIFKCHIVAGRIKVVVVLIVGLYQSDASSLKF